MKFTHYALEDAGVSANDVTLVEAHGTGTKIGDEAEVLAPSTVFGTGNERKAIGVEPLMVSSIKRNIGYFEAAA